jgi:hypothetical protein
VVGEGPGEYHVYRISSGHDIHVGSDVDRIKALNKLGLSLVAKAQSEGDPTATQRDKLRNLINVLDSMGLGDLSKAVLEVLS